MIRLRQVVGDSMLPTLRPDQLILLRRTRRLRVGDVVMVRHENLDKVKRITARRDDTLFIEGDNPAASKDSRQFGWIHKQFVQGKVIWPMHLRKRSNQK